ncbi:TlpA disulfide reductase family protein [Leadbettera azotonutricia]|uniref:Thiol-disulfide oxidoreductase ResA n=1 Tax=Leadbettera azotonutricia (strain ATCC BAA-888 / DSM 13862 / ZAS-9) TaxID=545695 RepID=F5YDX1_LEAAZ|nr:TlpA disulfide reductase family protein [Leadbettera azotonutricia]AEF80121.1 thiol-disulfide oxidoreductase ResA [Leadbettera azotonutricia ZAS-9]
MKKAEFRLVVLVLLLSPIAAFADPVPGDIAKAFADAGLPVLKDRINPIEFSLPLLDGKEQKLSALKGKVVFLNFWATWCGPCRVEMPSMENLYQRFKNQGLEILAVNCQEKNAEVLSFMKSNKFTFPATLDTSGSVSSRYGVRAIPTTCIIDRDGKIIIRVAGSLNWDNPKIIAAFEALLKS